MPAQSLHHLGDEPIYCEAVHDSADDVYSGSDDNHYEGKLHRRLHIEKKAIEFLNGQIPVLLSARLRGPFDSQHWNNPWISRRTEKQAENPGTQSTLSHLSIQRARDDGPDQIPEGNLPNTQGTSLYPLPSPEITNPPSARKNPYMEEEEYNRIKTWREAVKGTSISKDPFWLSQQDDSDSVSITRKRSADQQWLHKRKSKRQKPTDMRTSPPEESPSQAASKMRKRETRRPRPVSLSGQSTSAHEDELATGVDTSNATSASRLANRSIGTPRSRRIQRRSPRRKPRLQEAESSEDELSMPSTTPTHKAARSSAGKPNIPRGDGSPRRSRTTTTGIFQSHSGLDQADQGRIQVDKIQRSQLSARRLSKDAARLGMKAAESAGESPGPEAAKTYKPVQNESFETGSTARKLKTCTKQLADMALSQQDNSFCFHSRAKSPAEMTASRPSLKEPMDGTNPRLSSGKLHVSTAAVVEPKDDESCSSQDEENDDASIASNPANAMDLDPSPTQQIPCEFVENSEVIVGAQVANQIQLALADEVVEDGEPVRKDEIREIDGVKVMDATQAHGEPAAMVAVKAAGKSGNMREIDSNSEEVATDKPQDIDQDKNCAPSDPEWSTYLDTQDLPSTSATVKTVPEGTHGIPVVEQGIDDSSDMDWSSYVDTQELSAVNLKAEATQENALSVPAVVYQGTDDQTDPEWSTYLNTQDLSSATEPQNEDAESNYEDALDLETITLENYTPTVEDNGDSESEWSTYRSTSSQVDGDQTGDTSHKPVAPEALQDAKPSQASVGSIIDAYADTEQLSGMPGPDGESIVTDESDQGIIISMAGTIAAEGTKTGQEQGETAIHPNCTTPMKIQEAKEDSTEGSLTDPGGFDETTISIEPPKMADGGVLNKTPSSIGPRQVHSQPNIELQTPQIADIGADTTTDPNLLQQTTSDLEPPLSQSSWAKGAGSGSQVPALGIEPRPSPDSFVVDVTTKSTEALEIQSPWAKEPSIELHQPAAQDAYENDISLDGSSSALNMLAGKAVPFPQPHQSPWMTPTPIPSNLPSPDFTMSIKAFSDFATPSPTKKRASFNGSILRDRIKTPLFQKPRRRVHFAPLPDEEGAGSIEVDQNGDDTIYVEEDVSYFTPGGRKTGTIRVPRPAMRAASPPPMDVSSAEVGGLLDHDSKFAKHFEAVAKRKKNPPRKALRLLPSDSQQTTTASQDVEAMAEAFIQASQTRKAVEMTEMDTAEAAAVGDKHDLPSEKSFSPISVHPVEEQENADPVDDVSAVLDNLGEFLDNTWGVGLGAEVEEEETRAQPQPKKSQDRQSARGVFDMGGDPMRALSINVWAD
ncbi:hypothetical protein VMCG_05435 [Cytospora schulzeri]|uniref:Protamine P1 n=1 Tax=Cytospora schulzeri TaxID=448051 RepID=A0A423WJT5_9PEZI|nr:hypothetical protein VMCG_05435 [Valsa malicola]